MAGALSDALTRQFGIAAALLRYHLGGLTTEECLWMPAGRGLHVRRQSRGGRWVADWPEEESYAIGPPSAAWTTWHIGYWLTTALDRNFGSGTLGREDIAWPGSGTAAAQWIDDLVRRWFAEFGDLSEARLLEDGRSRWPYDGRPLADVLAWSTVELAKNAAELGMARFLYAVRSDAASPRTQTEDSESLPSSAK